MATMPLPQQPNLEQLRKQARDLQRAVRAGEPQALRIAGIDQAAPHFTLTSAHTALARHYGFASWTRLRRHVTTINDRTWVYRTAAGAERPTEQFLRLACLTFDHDSAERLHRAAALREAHPDLPSASLCAAAACADVAAVRAHLDRDAGAATRPAGPHGWSPLMYAAYARVEVPRDAAVATMTLLLDAGADPDDGWFFLGLPTPFTVLTGVFGGGEDAQRPHPYAAELARLLLRRGADPNDGQTLYNRMFGTDDDFLEILFDFGLGEGDGGPWRRRLPDLIPDPATQVRALLEWAVTHDQRQRVRLLAAHGVDLVTPLPSGATPVDLAARTGHRELAAELTSRGAGTLQLNPVDTFIAAALSGDSEAVRHTPPEIVAAARTARPALVVWAAGQGRAEVVALLVGAGFDVNAFGRADLPIEQKWQTALHTAVERDDPALVQRLLDLGADRTLRDRRFDSTPRQWADHLGRTDLAGL